MSKKKHKKKSDRMSTEEALTRLLGKKAAKRLREIAEGLEAEPGKPAKQRKQEKKKEKKNPPSQT